MPDLKPTVGISIEATEEMRELLADYQRLSPKDLQQMRAVGGLWGSITLLREVLGLFWKLRSSLDELDKEQEALASVIEKDPEAVDPRLPDIATSELLVATFALDMTLEMLRERCVESYVNRR